MKRDLHSREQRVIGETIRTKQKGGPLEWDHRVARRMLQAAVLVPAPPAATPKSNEEIALEALAEERRQLVGGLKVSATVEAALHPLDSKTMAPADFWSKQRIIWWEALARVEGGVAALLAPSTSTVTGNAPTALCLPALCCRRYSAYRAGLLMRAIFVMKRKFMGQAAKMQELRRRHHAATCRKWADPLLAWMWRCRIKILERFDAAVGYQKNIRRYICQTRFRELKRATIVFQKYHRGLLGRRKAALWQEFVLGNLPRVTIVYDRVRLVRNAEGPLRIKILKCGYNYMLEGFDYELCQSYRGFVPRERIEDLCRRYPYGVTGSYSLRKRIALKPNHVDEMCALLTSKLALVEPIKGLGEMEERSRAGSGLLVLVVDPLDGKTPEGLEGPGFEGIQGTYIEAEELRFRRESVAGNPWMTRPNPPLLLPPNEDWTAGARDAGVIWSWWMETLRMWKHLVRSKLPYQVRAAHRKLLRRQADAGNCRSNVIACFRKFDVQRSGYLATNVLESALMWLGEAGSKEHLPVLADLIQESLFVVKGSDAAARLEQFGRSRAAEISVGVSRLPGLKFGFIDYVDFVARADECSRTMHPKKSTLQGLMKEYAVNMRDREGLMYSTVHG